MTRPSLRVVVETLVGANSRDEICAQGRNYYSGVDWPKLVGPLYDSVISVEEEGCLQQHQAAGGAGQGAGGQGLEDLRREIARLRRTLLKHGHAQELFQERVEGAMDRLTTGSANSSDGRHRGRPAVSAASPAVTGEGLSAAQLRTLVELAQAVRNLQGLASGAAPAEDDDSPRSVREGLGLLEIRVTNLQRSFGLEPIPAAGKPFDDRRHRAHGICRREDLPDGVVVEELLPGYLLDGEVERPALVIVNRLAGEGREDERKER